VAQQMINERTFSTESIAELGGGPRAEHRMSVGGTVFKTLVLFVITCAFAAVGWERVGTVIKATSGPSWLLGYFILIALSFLAIANPRLAPLGGFVYALLMGLWIGAISRVYEVSYDGIVAQALLATMATVLVCLVLYVFRVVNVSRRFVLVVVAATFGIGLMYMTAWILSIFGVDLRFWTHPSSTGIIISIIICIVAALNLFIDFAVVDAGVHGGAPKFMEWYSAWGLLATVVWLYLEVLYLLARLRRG
jgi:uncharacterized YccA/Bax inhibitor family protein